MTSIDRTYVVVVESNLVVAIEPASAEDERGPCGSPLEIGTTLSERYRRSGLIDGRYRFENASGARVFATLCLQFTQALAQQRLSAIEKLPPAFDSYLAEDAAHRRRGG